LLLLIPAIWILVRRSGSPGTRMALALTLGPVAVALGFAAWKLNGWSGLDATLVALLATSSAIVAELTSRAAGRWAWGLLAAGVAFPGAILYFPRAETAAGANYTESEVYVLVERDLARWLSHRSGIPGEVAVAPHDLTFTLHHYGGLRGLATLGLDNLAGLEAAMRIVSASTPEEARELVDRRNVKYFVIPSWNSYLDVYARMGMGKMDETFLNRLHFWRLPPWLRPVAYAFPTIRGFEGQSVTVLEVVDDQDDAVALSRLAEYFVDMGQLGQAAAVAQSLRRFPADLGALVARGQVEQAREDSAAFDRTVEQVRSRIAGGGDKNLLLDRRASLAVLLARAKLNAPSAEQVRRCLEGLDEPGLRSLPTNQLFRLQVLARAFGTPIADPRLRQLALDLLPEEMRARAR
jgi:hypothetical protein